jgi:hypothetical protein
VLHGCANSAQTTGFLFPVLPTLAGYCMRVRVKLGSSVLGNTWMTRRQFLFESRPRASVCNTNGRRDRPRCRNGRTVTTAPRDRRFCIMVDADCEERPSTHSRRRADATFRPRSAPPGLLVWVSYYPGARRLSARAAPLSLPKSRCRVRASLYSVAARSSSPRSRATSPRLINANAIPDLSPSSL